MRLSRALFIAAIIAMAGFSSCKEKGGKNIEQGEIHYSISYKGSFGVPREALPREMVVSFKKNKILFEMLGIGNSGIVNLANPEKGIYDTYYSFFVKKYYYAGAAGEMYPGFESMTGMTIKKTGKTAVICGYNCKSAEVRLPGSDEAHEVWYTNEIKVKNPNASTPYSALDGVLMNFFFIMGSSELFFNAESIYQMDMPERLFDRKDKYIRVSRDDIKEVMNRMMSM